VAAFPTGILCCWYCTTLKHVNYHLATDVNVSATSFKIPCPWVSLANFQTSRWHGKIKITCWRILCGCLGKVCSRTGHEVTDRSRFIALLIHNLCSRNGLVVTATPQTLYPRERYPVPVAYEAGWALGRSERVRKISNPDLPACSESLYRQLLHLPFKNKKSWWTETS
jgi:hypothetical protein